MTAVLPPVDEVEVRLDEQEALRSFGVEVTLDDDERQRCEVWTRVMGYHRPTDSFNIGKKSEHRERRFFKEPA